MSFDIGVHIPFETEDGTIAVITNLYDDKGEETAHPIRAEFAVAVVLTGPHEGECFTMGIDFDTFRAFRYH